MRSFEDDRGRRWNAAVGKESYGSLVVLFSRHAERSVFKHPLGASTRLGAEDELARMSVGELRRRLDASVPWEAETIPGLGGGPGHGG